MLRNTYIHKGIHVASGQFKTKRPEDAVYSHLQRSVVTP